MFKQVHAFVKRDAPAAPDANILEATQKKFEDLTKDFNSQIANIDPDTIKTKFNEFFDNVNKAVSIRVKWGVLRVMSYVEDKK